MADEESQTYPRLFALTELTGKKSQADRTVPMWGIEFARRHIAILAISAIPALMLTGLSFPFLGVYSAFLFLAVIAGSFFLIEWRSRTGLKQRLYRTVYDKATAIDSEFILCGQRVPLTNYSPGIIYRSSELTQVSHREVALLEAERPGVTAGEEHLGSVDMFSVVEGEVSLGKEYFTTADIPYSQTSQEQPMTRRAARAQRKKQAKSGVGVPASDGLDDIFTPTEREPAAPAMAPTSRTPASTASTSGDYDDLEL